MSPGSNDVKIVQAPCACCLSTTAHDVLKSIRQVWEEGVEISSLLKCRGCSTASMGVETIDDRGDRNHRYYPSPVSRRVPSWAVFMKFGFGSEQEETLGDLLHEIHQAVRGDMPRLAAMGIRSLLEHLMIAHVGDKGSFRGNLEEFQSREFISGVQRKAVEALLNVGHAATHRSYKPTTKDLNLALDIVEGILAAIYEHGPAAAKMGGRVPAKPLRDKG